MAIDPKLRDVREHPAGEAQGVLMLEAVDGGQERLPTPQKPHQLYTGMEVGVSGCLQPLTIGGRLASPTSASASAWGSPLPSVWLS